MVLEVKNLPTNTGDTRDMRLISGQEDPQEQEMASHSSLLAWKIPRKPGGLQSLGLQRVGLN